jgi:hypothetical protein
VSEMSLLPHFYFDSRGVRGVIGFQNNVNIVLLRINSGPMAVKSHLVSKGHK